MQPISRGRRTFLKQSGAAAAAMAFSAAGGAVPSSAIEPIQRTGAARVKFSLAAYSFRGLLTGTKPKMTLHDFVDDCAKMPLEAAELTSYYFPKEVTGAYLAALKQHCFRQGLDVSGTAVGNDFCHGPGEARDRQIASVRRWVEHAAALGAPVIRIFSGSRRPTQSEAEAHRLAVAGIEQCCEYAGKHGVTLALENHGGLTSTVEGMLKLIHDVKSSALGVNMDTGNFHSTDVYADLERIAPYSVNVQVKVAVRSAGGRKQPADYARIAKILKRAGYRGYVALEFEESGDPRIECRKHIEQLRSAFSKVL